MRYRTTIEVVTEASDRAEAIEIVGEYLSGDVLSGVRMKCSTHPVSGVKKVVVTVTALSVLLVIGLTSALFIMPAANGALCASASSAVQAPLHTQVVDIRNADFKDQWQKEHTKEALRKIKFSDR